MVASAENADNVLEISVRLSGDSNTGLSLLRPARPPVGYIYFSG